MGFQELLGTPMIERPLLAGSLRESPRNDFEREVLLRFRDLETPVSATLKDISATGMFIRSRDARPEGSNLSFELSLRDGAQPVRGEGEVVFSQLLQHIRGSRPLESIKGLSYLQDGRPVHNEPMPLVGDLPRTHYLGTYPKV